MGHHITHLSYSSGNLVEEGVERIEELHVGEAYRGTVSFGCDAANALMNTLQLWLPPHDQADQHFDMEAGMSP